jgi:D-alanyl-D-alanine carboxypeptidase (penicillin-binding protein 5/6)
LRLAFGERASLMAVRPYRFACVAAAMAAGGLLLATPAPAQKKAAPKTPAPHTVTAPKKEAAKKDELGLLAPHAILIEAKSGSVLYERDADKLIYPASLGKLMTAEYVFHLLKTGKIKLTDEYEVSEHAWRTGGAPSHGSTMFAAIHSKVPVEALLYGMIVQSANDGAIILAEGIAGNETEFAEQLTKRAREIGLQKSTFANSNGLHDPNEQVTTRELAMLARRIILDYPEFYPIFAKPDYTWNKIHQFNRNPLLGAVSGADGLKTGFTKEAGYGLVGSAVENGLRLIVVVNGEKTAADRAREAKKLLEWGFRNFEERTLFADGEVLGSAKVYGGASGSVPLKADTGEVKIMVPKAGGERLIARIVYQGPVPAPVKKGTPVGVLKVWRGDNVVLETPVHAAADVDKGGLTRRAFDAVTESMIGLFRAGAERVVTR